MRCSLPASLALLGCTVLCLSIPFGATARADVGSVVNGVRTEGCEGSPGVKTKLLRNEHLDAVARRVAGGLELAPALKAAGYRAMHATALRLSRVPDDKAVRRALRQLFCTDVTARDFREMGVARRDQNAWIILAAAWIPPAPGDEEAVSRRVLALVNQARAHARDCGGKSFGPAPAVVLDALLSDAALEHSKDMAEHDRMRHEGSDGSVPADRVARTGYPWRGVAENVASGQATPETAVESWLSSPGHCANLMNPLYTAMGVAYATNSDSEMGIYWTQVFAVPR